MKEKQIITKKAKKLYNKTITQKTNQEQTTITKLKKENKNQTITIYDITTTNENTKTYKVVDHINKTGENPLRGKKLNNKKQFTDITKLYKNKKGITTTSLGKKYNKEKNKHKHPSTYISNIAIHLKALGFYNIKGILINTKKL